MYDTGVDFSFIPFCGTKYCERGFFMQKKDFFSLSRFRMPAFNVKRLCSAAMLLAITVVLAMFFTFRVGNAIKIPFKFISVYVTGALFGPWIGGFVGAAGDMINAFMSPVGAWLPQLTFCEFLCGVTYGVMFYGLPKKGVSYMIRSVICTDVLFIIDMFIVTAFLTGAGYFPSFGVAFGTRIAAGVLKAAIQAVFLFAVGGIAERFSALISKN